MATKRHNQGPRCCIFCGAEGRLTKEHVWPKWARSHLRFNDHRLTAASVVRYLDQTEYPAPRDWSGDPSNRALRVVCGACNSGWMSALQGEAKPLLLSMHEGRSFGLDAQDQATVAAWGTMTLMVAEHFFGDLIIVPDSERQGFSQDRAPLPTWKIWVARYDRDAWRAHYMRTPLLLRSPSEPPLSDGGFPTWNSFAATFVFGTLLFHAFTCPYVEFTDHLDIDDRHGRIIQIWPANSPIEWPSPLLPETAAKRFVTMIHDQVTGMSTEFDTLFPKANRSFG